jgi:hypothetical protein
VLQVRVDCTPREHLGVGLGETQFVAYAVALGHGLRGWSAVGCDSAEVRALGGCGGPGGYGGLPFPVALRHPLMAITGQGVRNLQTQHHILM